MSNVVKYGDTHQITFTVKDSDGDPVDLTGTTVRVLAVRDDDASKTVITLASAIGVAVNGTVTHQLTGTLPVGTYSVVVEVTEGGVITTSPSAGYVALQVTDGLG